VYRKPAAGQINQEEVHLYGSNRLGIVTRHLAPDSSFALANSFGKIYSYKFTRGEKLFELSNHLGNVLVTLSDRVQQVKVTSDTVRHYLADIRSANDYYPFGMLMPGRKFNAGSFRYGFNGKENDNEVKGIGNQQDYGMRIYDTRLGKFLSLDLLTPNYPMLTPYQFASNTPIAAIDLDGLEATFNYPSMVSALKNYKAPDVRNETHKIIATMARQVSRPSNPQTWTDFDIFKNFNKEKLFEVKRNFVSDFKTVINKAAAQYDIPPVLLAGVAFNEFGGDPPSIDDVAYSVRLFIGGSDKTSFGDLSMQLRVAMETLGYNKSQTLIVGNSIIESLNNPTEAFFIVAKHLSALKDVDFKNKKGSELTDEEIKVVGTRYNRGAGLPLEAIKKNLSYGQAIIKRKEELQSLIKEEGISPASSGSQNPVTQ
jgi:RHS repeat-associated protein